MSIIITRPSFDNINSSNKGNYRTIADILSKENEVRFLGSKPLSVDIRTVNYTNIVPNSILKRFIKLSVELFIHLWKKSSTHIISIYASEFDGFLATIFGKLFRKKVIVRLSNNIVVAHKYKSNTLVRFLTYFYINIVVLTVLRYADAIVLMSEAVKQQLIENGINKDRIHVIMQKMDYEEFKIDEKIDKKELALKEDKKNILFAGTLTKRKGMQTLLKFSKDQDLTEKYHFIIAGKDKGYASSFPEESTTYLGKIPRDELIQYYNTVDLFFFPSYMEGFPKVVTEAYASGCPIVARQIVNTDRLADYTFTSDKEAKNILLQEEFERKKDIDWPKEFKPEIVEKRWLNLIKNV